MSDDILRVAQSFKEQTRGLSQEESMAHFEKQKERYEREYTEFLEHHEREECYLCGKSIKTISKENPCLHWLLRKCKFKKKDFPKITENYDFYNISSYLRWVAHAESGVKNINNLKEESSDRKIFETTIKWQNIEWTLDCSKNDFSGHEGSKTDFPHWHFQMRVDGNQFINFNDFHIKFSKDDQLKIVLENDPDSGFHHTFGPGGEGMQEHMDRMADDPDEFIANAMTAENPDDGTVHMQSIVTAPEGGISGEKINEALEMARTTGKTLAHCFREVLSKEEGVSVSTIASPAESVPEIAKRTERKRR
ncbi:hypothetical protein CGJ04_23200 [Vibrio parahaemolyticus]|uniref:hypothetical protein n=1 Tax=Vibrio parahaemolyticus TaxID=670 RepID=UPI001122913B|nr:hypothetical protein [Vibrio parahaemolyticus]TOG28233.1 hypothetical protein CGJ04_23200 [Vibrio parahaemolyticus]